MASLPTAVNKRTHNSAEEVSELVARSQQAQSSLNAQLCKNELLNLKKPKKTSLSLPVRNVHHFHHSTASFVQIYGTGCDIGDTVPTVLLFFDRQRFIFNAGEGFLRFCTEYKVKLSKLDHVFLTRICSETSGGLPGLLLTLAGLGETGMAVQIWGPSEVQNLVNAIRGFVPNAAMMYSHSFELQKYAGDKDNEKSFPIPVVEDELVKISAVCLSSITKANIDHNDVETECRGDTSVVYVCELPDVIGKFDPGKALAKGLKPGIKYGKLQKGESVMSDDGSEMVHPADVLGPPTPGPIMILVDCPSVSHIPSLTSSESLGSYFYGCGKVVNCIVHLSPTCVTSCGEYQGWMANFKKAQHIFAGREDPSNPVLRSSALLLSKLNLVAPRVFPITGFIAQKGEPCTIAQEPTSSRNVMFAKNLLKFHFRPIDSLGIDSSLVPERLDVMAAQEKFKQDCPEILEALNYVSRIWEDLHEENSNIPACILSSTGEEMEIVFLGTCSSQPSKYRNVSAIYMHLFDRGGLLLDCGEGTYAQFQRRYGERGVEDVLLGLRCIWISHIHADHHAGLPRLLSLRKQVLERRSSIIEPVLVIGPRQLKRYLDAYDKVEDLCMDFLDCSQTTSQADNAVESCSYDYSASDKMHGVGMNLQEGVDVKGREKLHVMLQSMGLKKLLSVQVVHCLNAYGVVLESKDKEDLNGSKQQGWKVVYSGDTRPCQALIEAAHGATVLIHEATFDDSLVVDAIMKNHSTTKEAIEVGVAAQVYRIILTHFSQRYPKIPVFNGSCTDNVCLAFDMMSVNLLDLPLIPKLIPAFKMIFKDEVVDNDDMALCDS